MKRRIATLAFLCLAALATAYPVYYKEQYYKLYHIHYIQYPDDTIENIYYLEQAAKADFCNPLYALAKIEDKEGVVGLVRFRAFLVFLGSSSGRCSAPSDRRRALTVANVTLFAVTLSVVTSFCGSLVATMMETATATSIEQPDSDGAGATMTIEQLAARSGITVRNIRSHRSRGLLPPPEVRDRIGYYGPEHLNRLLLIKDLQGRARPEGDRAPARQQARLDRADALLQARPRVVRTPGGAADVHGRGAGPALRGGKRCGDQARRRTRCARADGR